MKQIGNRHFIGDNLLLALGIILVTACTDDNSASTGSGSTTTGEKAPSEWFIPREMTPLVVANASLEETIKSFAYAKSSMADEDEKFSAEGNVLVWTWEAEAQSVYDDMANRGDESLEWADVAFRNQGLACDSPGAYHLIANGAVVRMVVLGLTYDEQVSYELSYSQCREAIQKMANQIGIFRFGTAIGQAMDMRYENPQLTERIRHVARYITLIRGQETLEGIVWYESSVVEGQLAVRYLVVGRKQLRELSGDEPLLDTKRAIISDVCVYPSDGIYPSDVRSRQGSVLAPLVLDDGVSVRLEIFSPEGELLKKETVDREFCESQYRKK